MKMAESSSSKLDYDKYVPIQGGLLLEALVEDLNAHIAEKRGLKKDSELAKMGFEVAYAETVSREEEAVTGRKWKSRVGNVPVQKGKVLKLSKDAYGEVYHNRYGMDAVHAEVGDIVMFIPGQAFRVDLDGKFLVIKDEDVMLIERG